MQHATLDCRGNLLDLSTPKVMGILNITPDSFYDGGRYADLSTALERASEMLEEGASIIDIGAVSTRPGSVAVSRDEEKRRLMPVIEGILKNHPEAILSVDTFRADVAREAIGAGAAIINDISGGTLDKKMFETIADLNVPYVLMHIRGTPETMQQHATYRDVTREVLQDLAGKAEILKKLGVSDIIVDPGFGFGKTMEHNYTLMRELEYFGIINLPLLIGISRKSMIHKALNISSDDSLTGTIALHFQALLKGADILRVHDVKAAVQTIGIFRQLYPSLPETNPIAT